MWKPGQENLLTPCCSLWRILQASFISVTTLMSGLILNFVLPLQIWHCDILWIPSYCFLVTFFMCLCVLSSELPSLHLVASSNLTSLLVSMSFPLRKFPFSFFSSFLSLLRNQSRVRAESAWKLFQQKFLHWKKTINKYQCVAGTG